MTEAQSRIKLNGPFKRNPIIPAIAQLRPRRQLLLKLHLRVTLLSFLVLLLVPFPRELITLPAVVGTALCLVVFAESARRIAARANFRHLP